MVEKSPEAFRTISEVAEELDLPQHVLRFWETRFSQIKPLKRGGGRRYYRPDDIDLLCGVRLLLYGEGYTIKGVQRLLKEKGVGFVVGVGRTGFVETVAAGDPERAETRPRAEQSAASANVQGRQRLPSDQRKKLESALSELLEAKRLLDRTIVQGTA